MKVLLKKTNWKNQITIKKSNEPTSIIEAASKNYFDTLFNDLGRMNNTAHINFNDKILGNVRFVKVNSLAAVYQHFTPKQCVDVAVVEKSFVRKIHDNIFNNFTLVNINGVALKTQDSSSQ